VGAVHSIKTGNALVEQDFRFTPYSQRAFDLARLIEVSGQIVIQASNPEAEIMRYELSDDEWAVIRPMLPNKTRGVPRVDDRRVLMASFGAERALFPGLVRKFLS
jgi:hypothetical protein